MKTTILLISLWALSCAHPVPSHQNLHYVSFEKQEDTISEESLNEEADSIEDAYNSPESSAETGDEDSNADEHENIDEENHYASVVPSRSSESADDIYGNDVDARSTQDYEDDDRFRIKQAQALNWADYAASADLDDVEEVAENNYAEQSAEKNSMVDINEIPDTDDSSREMKEKVDTENDGFLYKSNGFDSSKGDEERNYLTDQEDDSGDDVFDENNEEDAHRADPKYTIHPTGADEHNAFARGDQDGDRATDAGKKDSDSSSSSSSSSSSESRGLDNREDASRFSARDRDGRHGHNKRNRGDSTSSSSSEEVRDDFDDEGMLGDDPSIFESEDNNSNMVHGALHSKESSQETSREHGHLMRKSSNKSLKHSQSQMFQNGGATSEEDVSTEDDDDQSREADDSSSKEDSKSTEDSHFEDDVASQSREDVISHSKENVTSRSSENVSSQSSEDSRESQEESDENSKDVDSKSDEHSGSKSKEGQEDRDSHEDDSEISVSDSESLEDQREHSKSEEKSKSTEDSLESEEDKDGLSHSKSKSDSEESNRSEKSNASDSNEEVISSEELQDQDSKSAEINDSESKEEQHSHSRERDSESSEHTESQSTSQEDDSVSRSIEIESRKLILDVYHNKPIGDYDDNDCQDGY